MDSWRLIEHGPGGAHWNMAVDEALFRSFSGGETPAVVRFYGWDSPAISLGRFQRVEGSIDVELCKGQGIALVRRPTGGRAVFHGTDVTFSIVKENDGGSVAESYRELGEAVAAELSSIGIPAVAFSESSGRRAMRSETNCFNLKSRFEVGVNGRKALGSAQFRTDRAILQQNSLILGNGAVTGVDLEAVRGAVRAAIRQAFGVTLNASFLSKEEESTAEELVRGKYGVDLWNLVGSDGVSSGPSRLR
ncbi:MAG: biotin/lipoate A/B protein ligase family protein [Armatimonadota bacterium]|nr:biotin/lipoate A/B protein ligase family protein [Armatimonadota bacterium]